MSPTRCAAPRDNVLPMSSPLDRYQRQMLLSDIGRAGQEKLSTSTAVLLGCGALGCAAADLLIRAGVGHLVIVDRDIVELSNLQRQVLFDESDASRGMPKSEAAKRRLSAINSNVRITAIVDDLNHRNIEGYTDGADILIDGLDNFETRYLTNDVAVKHRLPYVYGGAVGTTGMTIPLLPHGDQTRGWATGETDLSTPCFRCLFPEAPDPGSAATCDTVGVLNSAIGIVAGFQVTEALKILTGDFGAVNRKLVTIDLWRNDIVRLDVSSTYESGGCACCKERRFDYLSGVRGSSAVALCGRNAVQLRHQSSASLSFEDLAVRLQSHGSVNVNEFVMRANIDEASQFEITVFKDGRAIVKGTDDPATARSVYAKYIGS